jgi:hypothetical protein
MEIKLKVIKKLFSFSSMQDWIDNAKLLYNDQKLPYRYMMAIDSIGRPCLIGLHFKQAEKEKTYPIDVYQIKELP